MSLIFNKKDIQALYYNNKEIQSLYYGQNLIFDNSQVELMPVMNGITNYYDCKSGLTESSWNNLVSENNNVSWTGMTIQQDGSAGVMCRSTSYGAFNCPQDEARVIYTVMQSPSANSVRYALGSAWGKTTGNYSAIRIEASSNLIGLDAYGYYMQRVSSVPSTDWHVVTIRAYKSSQYPYENQMELYIDGLYINKIGSSLNKPAQTFGIGVLRNWDGILEQATQDTLLKTKFVAVGTTTHNAEQIAQNTAWLQSYFGLT